MDAESENRFRFGYTRDSWDFTGNKVVYTLYALLINRSTANRAPATGLYWAHKDICSSRLRSGVKNLITVILRILEVRNEPKKYKTQAAWFGSFVCA